MPKYKATAYIRLSYTDDHSSESDSVSNQRKLIENFVEHNPDIEVVSEKIDDGYSGIIFDRPAFKEMMQDVTDGNINCVIVKDLSRLGREYIETGRYLRRVFPAYGVRFIAITDSIDTAHDSGDDLTVSVKNIMNEAYCRDISIKTRSSLDVKRRNGDFVGAFPVYGYMKAEDNKNLLVPDPYAARVVCDIFRMRLEGASASKIASELNRLGILSPLAYKKNNGLPYAKKGYADKADCKWSATTIIRILQDETYTGTLVQGKRTLYERYLMGEIDLNTYKAEKAACDELLLKTKNTYAAVLAQAKQKQDEQARQDSRKEASKAIFDADTLTTELAELLIDRVLVYPDKRIEVAYKIQDIFD